MQKQTSENSHGVLMLFGAVVGALLGAPVGVGIASLAGMLEGWSWPFVVLQVTLAFAMSLAWTAPLLSTASPESEPRDETNGVGASH